MKDTSGNSWDNSFNGLDNGDGYTFSTMDITAPFITSITPANGAVDVSKNSNIEFTFNEKFDADMSSTDFFTVSDSEGQVTTYGVNDLLIDGNGRRITIDPPSNFAPGTKITVTLSNLTGLGGIVTDRAYAPNNWDHSFGTGVVTYTFDVIDNVAPRVASLSPSDGSTGVATNTDLEITFNEDIILNSSSTDTISLKNLGTNSSTSFGVSSMSVTNNNKLVVDVGTLLEGVEYEVIINGSNQLIKDANNNFWTSGFSPLDGSDSKYKFTTVAPPIICDSSTKVPNSDHAALPLSSNTGNPGGTDTVTCDANYTGGAWTCSSVDGSWSGTGCVLDQQQKVAASLPKPKSPVFTTNSATTNCPGTDCTMTVQFKNFSLAEDTGNLCSPYHNNGPACQAVVDSNGNSICQFDAQAPTNQLCRRKWHPDPVDSQTSGPGYKLYSVYTIVESNQSCPAATVSGLGSHSNLSDNFTFSGTGNAQDISPRTITDQGDLYTFGGVSVNYNGTQSSKIQVSATATISTTPKVCLYQAISQLKT